MTYMSHYETLFELYTDYKTKLNQIELNCMKIIVKYGNLIEFYRN